MTLLPDILTELFREGGFNPHAFCLAYDPFAVDGMILGHRLIEIAYSMIPIQLLWAIYRRANGYRIVPKNLNIVLGLFVVFILSCMIGHRLSEVNFVRSLYRLEAAWHIWTGVVSLATAGLTPFLIHFEPREE